jgi:hypothetical protein
VDHLVLATLHDLFWALAIFVTLLLLGMAWSSRR